MGEECPKQGKPKYKILRLKDTWSLWGKGETSVAGTSVQSHTQKNATLEQPDRQF